MIRLFLAVGFLVTAQSAVAQTSAGVYTTEQAARGQDVFAGMCQSCHSAGTFTAPSFQNTWRGRTLWHLFSFVSEKMPKNDPGSLEMTDYRDVLAYVLKLNGIPAGATELSTDSISLKTIRFEPPEKVRKTK